MFSPESSVQAAAELLPVGTLAKCLLVIKDVKTGKDSGAQYVNVELRVTEGPFEGRVFFDMISNPLDPKASEGGKKMGILALTRICEAVGVFSHTRPESYNRYNRADATIFDILKDIDGHRVCVRTRIEKGKDGHADKTKVAEYLTPNPNSGTGYKDWEKLMNPQAAGNPPERANAFGQQAGASAPSNSADPSWLKNPGA